MVGFIYNNGICIWYVDICFNDGSIYKYVVVLVVEVVYYVFKFMFVYLVVIYCNMGFGNDFSDFFGCLCNVIYFVVKEVNLIVV